MDFRRKAIELYNQGKSIGEINKEIGIELDEDMVKKWANEGKFESYKSIIFKLDKEQRHEKAHRIGPDPGSEEGQILLLLRQPWHTDEVHRCDEEVRRHVDVM